MKYKRGFTMVEILVTATILSIVSTPFLLALSNLGFRYRNLRNSYYAQLVAQQHMEKITNVIQGKNPGEYPYSNYFCNQIKLKNDDSTEIPCTGNGILMENIPNRLYLTPKNGNEYKFSNTPVDNLDELDGLNFTYQIILNPACRRAGVIEPLGTLADTTCVSGQTQDTHTMEIIVLVNWDPPGPLTTAQYQISTLFTEFIEFPPAP